MFADMPLDNRTVDQCGSRRRYGRLKPIWNVTANETI